jgi:hypothetical protein
MKDIPSWEDIMRVEKAEERRRKAALAKRGRDQFKRKNRRAS